MSIVPVSSEIIIPERMNSVNTAFIDGTLPVDPSLDEGTKKDLDKACFSLFATSNLISLKIYFN